MYISCRNLIPLKLRLFQPNFDLTNSILQVESDSLSRSDEVETLFQDNPQITTKGITHVPKEHLKVINRKLTSKVNSEEEPL